MTWDVLAWIAVVLAGVITLSAIGNIATALSTIADELVRLRFIADEANRRTESLTPNPNAPFSRPGTRR